MRYRKSFEEIYSKATQDAKEERISELKSEQQQASDEARTIKEYIMKHESDMPSVVVEVLKRKIKKLEGLVTYNEIRLTAYDEDGDI